MGGVHSILPSLLGVDQAAAYLRIEHFSFGEITWNFPKQKPKIDLCFGTHLCTTSQTYLLLELHEDTYCGVMFSYLF